MGMYLGVDALRRLLTRIHHLPVLPLACSLPLCSECGRRQGSHGLPEVLLAQQRPRHGAVIQRIDGAKC